LSGTPLMSWGGSPAAGGPSTWILSTYRSRLLPSSPIAISKSNFRHSSPIDEPGLLAVTDTVGSSTWMTGIVALWNASVNGTASTYFHAIHGKARLCKIRLCMYTWLFCILNMLIYISFSSQHHNTAEGRDTTLSTSSWTQQEEPTTMTWWYRFRFNCVLRIVE
jgi:hypothetical protein